MYESVSSFTDFDMQLELTLLTSVYEEPQRNGVLMTKVLTSEEVHY